MALKFGMREWQPEAVKLKFADYVNRIKVPPVYGHVKRNDVPWGTLGNTVYGDCVLAGAAHEVMVWALATKRALPQFTDRVVVEQYLSLNGGKDEGLDPVSTAKWRVSTGLTDADGTAHKVKAFAGVNYDWGLDVAAYVFGVCGVGMMLPDSALDEFTAARPWSKTTGEGKNGHYIPLVGRNSHGLRFVVTWGRLQAVTDAFFRKYFVGGVCYLSLEYLLETGKSPELLDEAQLETDLKALV